MASYLTPQEAHDLLLEFEIDALPSLGALEVASMQVDRKGPFWGARRNSPQALAFPRTYVRDGDTDNVVPRAIEIWVAVEAYRRTPSQSGGDKPPISSISHAQAGSVTYARPKVSELTILQDGLLEPYQVKTAYLR